MHTQTFQLCECESDHRSFKEMKNTFRWNKISRKIPFGQTWNLKYVLLPLYITGENIIGQNYNDKELFKVASLRAQIKKMKYKK